MERLIQTVRVRLDRVVDRSHDIVFDSVDHLPALLRERGVPFERCLMVTDSNVARHHAPKVKQALALGGADTRVLEVPPGERSKSMESFGQLVDRALAEPVDRQTLVVALGGGVVGDLAGFLAATLLRGLPFVQVPTSLVAQVDSAIGGKTGVNHASGKNLVGAFYQPRLVVVDTSLMQTLPIGEWMDGLSEVVKYGLIADAAFASFLLGNWESIADRDPSTVEPMVRRCVEIKADVVSSDETEQGLRAILNFGHTFGHAIERSAGYGTFTHGQAVAVGMHAALRLSEMLYPSIDFDEAFSLVKRLPAPALRAPVAELTAAMQADKKRLGTRMRFVVLEDVGRAVVVDDVRPEAVKDAWTHVIDVGT